MFPAQKYINRRKGLRSEVKKGLILVPGNQEAPCNYKDNTYRFRQDSTFSYFFGIDESNLMGLIDLDENREYLIGNNLDIDDIVWMGPQPSMMEKAALAGVAQVMSHSEAMQFISAAISKKRDFHYTTPYRGETELLLRDLLGISQLKASVELTKAIVNLRSLKDADEIADIEQIVDVAWMMHTTAMKIARPGTTERKIAGIIEGIALSQGNGVSFPIILSMNGETLHNHLHGNVLKKGRLMVTDAGAESELLYASDITRTVPVGGKFDSRQKDIYNIVLQANLKAIELLSPERPYLDVHLAAAKVIASGLADLGLMKGNIDDIVREGAHALFFPHGLGHMMGLDVHDMENLGENYVGYDDTVSRSSQFGLAYLRFARKPLPGYVLTDEPGIYFIPALIDLWRSEKKFTEFINYDKLDAYKGFGGIRIEDDLLVTENGCRVLGKPIPKTVEEIEGIMA
jgi:Xaa-Pro aminopeptidase